MTSTYAKLEVSTETYREIGGKLLTAGYIVPEQFDGNEPLKMQGLALTCGPSRILHEIELLKPGSSDLVIIRVKHDMEAIRASRQAADVIHNAVGCYVLIMPIGMMTAEVVSDETLAAIGLQRIPNRRFASCEDSPT